MTVRAIHRHAKISPFKVRLVADLIRGLPVDRALEILSFTKKESAGVIKKVLESAIANAEHNRNWDIEDLKIFSVNVDEGPRQNRWMPRAKGRATPICKRSSHIKIELTQA